MEGMKSRKVWVIDMETRKTTSAIIGIAWKRVREEVRIAATRFMWIPGKRPVRVPAIRPRMRARIISNNILV